VVVDPRRQMKADLGILAHDGDVKGPHP